MKSSPGRRRVRKSGRRVRLRVPWIRARRGLCSVRGPARAAKATAAPAARAATAPEALEAGAASLGCGFRAICAQVEVGRGGKEWK